MIKKLIKIFAWLLLLVIFSIISINIYVISFSKTWYYNKTDDLLVTNLWLVLWASVKWNKEPSDILKDRLVVASEAYKKWKIKNIIVSWDNWEYTYNEPLAMQKFLIKSWVIEKDIYLDYAWFDTYDSLYRAKEIFWADSLVIFTQDFHLKRAMYISKKLWIETYWVETNLHTYRNSTYNSIRETFARIKAFLEIEILKPKPKFLWERIEIISEQKLEETKEQILKE